MSRLKITIDNKSREEVIGFVMDTIKEEGAKFTSITFGHLSENGLHVTIEGERADMERLRSALEKKGEIASIHE